MGTPAIEPVSSLYCTQCGAKLHAGDRFCNKCGTATSPSQPSLCSPLQVPAPPVKPQEFERNLRVAWSSLRDVENKVDEIRQARDAGDREVNEGTFRGTMAMSALQGRLEKEFRDGLELAWKSAARAVEIDGDGYIEVEDGNITPKDVFAGVSVLRGDLQFALEKWDEAVMFYNQALRCAPGNPGWYYNIGAAYTNKHDPTSAMQAFQKVVDLDPMGHFGIEAAKNLEKLRIGALGKKGFSGSWMVVAVLGGMTLISCFIIGVFPVSGFINLFFWGGILALYCRRKYK